MVASGCGVCLMPDTMAARQTSLVRALRTDCSPVDLCAVWPRNESSLLLQQYLAILRAHLAEHPVAAACPA